MSVATAGHPGRPACTDPACGDHDAPVAGAGHSMLCPYEGERSNTRWGWPGCWMYAPLRGESFHTWKPVMK